MQQQQPTSHHSHSDQLSKENLISLFKGWKKIFRSKMKDEDWDMDTVIVWHIALNDLGITADEFNLAKRKSLGLSWPPTAPADFLALSRTETVSNYPDMRQSYLQAAQGTYKHPVALETAKRVGEWDIKSKPESMTYKAWQQHYPIVCSEHSNGADFTTPVSHQVQYEHTPVQAGTAASANIDAFLARNGSKAV